MKDLLLFNNFVSLSLQVEYLLLIGIIIKVLGSHSSLKHLAQSKALLLLDQELALILLLDGSLLRGNVGVTPVRFILLDLNDNVIN